METLCHFIENTFQLVIVLRHDRLCMQIQANEYAPLYTVEYMAGEYD